MGSQQVLQVSVFALPRAQALFGQVEEGGVGSRQSLRSVLFRDGPVGQAVFPGLLFLVPLGEFVFAALGRQRGTGGQDDRGRGLQGFEGMGLGVVDGLGAVEAGRGLALPFPSLLLPLLQLDQVFPLNVAFRDRQLYDLKQEQTKPLDISERTHQEED